MTENSNIAQNLRDQRNHHGYTLEQVAEKVHVSRQAIAKWESGESAPDISHADLLANLYGITLDNLIHYSIESNKVGIPPKGKSLYGTVTVGERGQIVIPKKLGTCLALIKEPVLLFWATRPANYPELHL